MYRHTRTFLKIRSTPTDGKQKAQMREWMPKTMNAESQAPAVPNRSRNLMEENSHNQLSPGSIQLPLPILDLPNSQNFSERREEMPSLQNHCTTDINLQNALSAPNAPLQ